MAHPESAPASARAPGAGVTLFINASAGAGDKDSQLHEVEQFFRAEGREVETITLQSAGDLGARIASARRAGRTIVAGGGDGTINAVASHVARTGAALGILPLGTLNHFAKDLGIPLELEAAVKVVTAGHTRLVDIGEVNGAIFLNNSSFGIYPRVVRLREQKEELGHPRWAAFTWAILHVLRRPSNVDVHLDVDGKRLVRRTPFVLVSNNCYETKGLGLGERKTLDGGRLGLYLLKDAGRRALLRVAAHAFTGTLERSVEFEQHEAKEIRVEGRHRRATLALDGEVSVMQMPFDYKILPGELSVLVPKPEAASGNTPKAQTPEID